MSFPKLIAARQRFPVSPPLDIPTTVQNEFATSGVLARVKPGARIAVGVGSRGITNLAAIVSAVLAQLKAAGAQPFIIPAMGSHGGATPEGQTEILAEYGVTEATMGVPIRASLEVRQTGVTEDGVGVFCSVEALDSDGIVLINRIKPHTDFAGVFGSGVLKMCVIGLGKRTGAAAAHEAATRLGHERVLLSAARVQLKSAAPILCGVGLVEDQHHQTAKLAVLPPETLEAQELALFKIAQRLFPKLPFEELDLLIIDRIGKNISGAGMDPNVTGRGIHGYYTALAPIEKRSPFFRRIFVRDLTPETHGNAIGIGFADVTTTRLVQGMNREATYVNALTSMTPNSAKIPIYFDTDREALTRCLDSLALPKWSAARIVRISDTLNLTDLRISENLLAEARSHGGMDILGEPAELCFDPAGNLLDLGTLEAR